MISILALVPDENAPSCRFRIRQFVEPLAAEGIALEVREIPRSRPERKRLFRSLAGTGAVILHRKLLRRPDYLRLRKYSRRLIYDFDDAVMYRDSNAGRFDSRRRLAAFRRLAAGADLVTAGNAYLKGLAAEAGGRVEIFPTVVDIAPFSGRSPEGTGETIGWMGTSSNFIYLSLLTPAIRVLQKARPGLTFRVVADRPPDLAGVEVSFRRWTEEGEAGELAGFTVGVMPLFDDPWTRGKCAFKAIQYGAASVPAVVSPVGANLEVIREGVTGYFARTEGEWRERLEELLDSPKKRGEMGRAARRLVEERYSLDTAVPRLAALLRRAADG